MTHNISRRSLIAGSALSALALGAAGQAQARTQNCKLPIGSAAI